MQPHNNASPPSSQPTDTGIQCAQNSKRLVTHSARDKSERGDEECAQPVSPVSLPAEMVVLGGLIESPDLLPEAVASGLAVRDFSLSDHRRIFVAILAMLESKLPIDFVLLAEHLGGSQDDYVLVASLIDGVIIERSHILHHVALVRKKSKLRQLERMGAGLVTSATETGADPDKIAALVREQLHCIVPAGVAHHV
jgi:replicative DNA helicase